MLITSVRKKLEKEFQGAKVEVIDESLHHEGHGSAGAHLSVTVEYDGFAGKSKIEQHQSVYNLLKEEMAEKIHALKLITKVK